MLFLVTLRTLSIVSILVLYIFCAHIFLIGSLRVFFPWRPKAATGLCYCRGSLVIGDRRIIKSHQRALSAMLPGCDEATEQKRKACG